MENFRIQFENIDKVTPNDTEIGGDFDYFSKNCILCFTNLCFYLENGLQESYGLYLYNEIKKMVLPTPYEMFE